MSAREFLNKKPKPSISMQGLWGSRKAEVSANRSTMFLNTKRNVQLAVKEFKYQVLACAAYLKDKLTSGSFAAASNMVDNTPKQVKTQAMAKFLAGHGGYVKVLT